MILLSFQFIFSRFCVKKKFLYKIKRKCIISIQDYIWNEPSKTGLNTTKIETVKTNYEICSYKQEAHNKNINHSGWTTAHAPASGATAIRIQIINLNSWINHVIFNMNHMNLCQFTCIFQSLTHFPTIQHSYMHKMTHEKMHFRFTMNDLGLCLISFLLIFSIKFIKLACISEKC